MKLNRVLSTFVLTALLSGATMVAQAQTGIYLHFGGGRGPVVAAQYYQPAYPGPGYVWMSGYYSGPNWVPGYWARRDDDDGGYYGNYYGRYYNNYYRGDDDHRWRRDDDWRDRGYRGGDDNRWRGEDHHDNGWHGGREHDREDDR